MDEDSESASESSEDAPDDFQHLENFVRDSKAFESFRQNLGVFIHPGKAQPASRRNSLSVKQDILMIPLPEILQNFNEELFMTSIDAEGSTESTEALINLTKVQEPPSNMNLQIIRRVYQPILQKLALLTSTISVWKRQPVADGKTRIEWHCKCGHKIYDDFTELRPGAANRLRQALTNHKSGSTNTSRSSTFNNCCGSFLTSLSSIFTLWNSNSPRKGLESGLPTHEPPKN